MLKKWKGEIHKRNKYCLHAKQIVRGKGYAGASIRYHNKISSLCHNLCEKKNTRKNCVQQKAHNYPIHHNDLDQLFYFGGVSMDSIRYPNKIFSLCHNFGEK